MKRALLFVALLIVFIVMTFPHRRVVERTLTRRLAPLGVDITLGDLTPTWWPFGYHIVSMTVAREPYSLAVDSLHVGLHISGALRFDADACGGTIRGSLREEDSGNDERPQGTRTLEMVFDDVDPADCLRTAGLEVQGRFGGELVLGALGEGTGAGLFGRASDRGHLTAEGHAGVVSGSLPAQAGGGRPIGVWKFDQAAVDARLRDGDLLIDGASARAEGVEWVVTRARVAGGNAGAPPITADFRARRLDDSTRSKAVIGLMPKASEKDGWRSYRVSGTLAAPHVIGLR